MRIAGKLVRTSGTRGGLYFLDQQDVEYIHSGAEVLDQVLGGGWANCRFVNIIGDSGAGKTGLAIEVVINFKRQFPKAEARYCEPESAFGRGYAKELGLKVDEIDFTEDDADIDTVEDFSKDIDTWLDNLGKKNGIYVLDSLDALSDDAELEREFSEKTYAMTKQKKLGEMFRKIIRKLKAHNSMLIIISQVRDNINASFGAKHRRSGGRALDFYASQVVWLAHLGGINRTIQGIKRETGRMIKVNCSKNKAGIPHRQCEIQFRYGYGLDDLASNIKYLASVGRMNLVQPGYSADRVQEFINSLDSKPDHEYQALRSKVAKLVPEVWREVEAAFLPNRRKYR